MRPRVTTVARDRDPCFAGLNFPCQRMDAYAVAILGGRPAQRRWTPLRPSPKSRRAIDEEFNAYTEGNWILDWSSIPYKEVGRGAV